MKKYSPKYIIQFCKFALILLLCLLASWYAQLGWHSFQLVRLAVRGANLATSETQNLDAPQAIEMVGLASKNLNALVEDLRPVFAVQKAMGIVPGLGPFIRQIPPLAELAAQLSQVGEQLALALEPVWDEALAQQSMPERLFQALKNGDAHFQQAGQALERADRSRQEIDANRLPDPLGGYYEQFDQNFPLLKNGLALLPRLPEMMGDGQPARYLVLAQNRDELRASGGFITGIGVVELQQGDITRFEIGDSYQIDDFSKPYPTPPEPIHRLMLADYWVTRDANWSPDFPSAAHQTQELYELSTGIETQGVIAFDQLAVSLLVETLGSIQLGTEGEPITAENIETYMQQAWAPESPEGLTGEWWVDRKDFMGQLGQAILSKILQSQEPGALLRLGTRLLELVRTGHVLVYFEQPQVQELLLSQGLDHSLSPGAGDFFLLVDSNIGFNKVDAVIQRQVEYKVDLRNLQAPTAEIQVTYQHTHQSSAPCEHVPSYGDGTYTGMMARCYWNYWRIYTPGSSQLVKATANPVPAEQLMNGTAWPGTVENYPGEAGTQVFAGLLVLPAQQSQEVQLQMTLDPQQITRDDQGELGYSLTIQKQPGLATLPITLHVLGPEGYQLEFDSPAWKAEGPSAWTWTGDIRQDQTFQVRLKPPAP